MRQFSAGAASSTASGSHASAGVSTSTSSLVEVWGDTVDLKHLAWSVFLGITISVSAFQAGKYALSSVIHDPAIVRAYAMLVGLGGCLVAGTICALLFKPKRTVIEHAFHEAERAETLRQLEEEWGGIGLISDLSPSAKAELQELGLLELFAAHEASQTQKVEGGR